MIEKVHLLTLFNSSFLLKPLKKTHFQIILLFKEMGLKGIDMRLDCKTVRIFAYSSTREQSNKRSRMRLKTESETPLFTDFFTDFEKKTDCFAV